MKKLEIIAELHPQHSGDMGVLREMIRQCRINGADTVKFQLYDAPALFGCDDWNYLQFTNDQVAMIKSWCELEGVEFLASIFDEKNFRLCEELGVKRYKIASRSVVDTPDLCRKILNTGKETIISLGKWTGTEKPFGNSSQIKYLYCKSKYPSYIEDMTDFPDDFELRGLAGYSDHTLGMEVCFLAMARGATVIEKHFTLNKTWGKPTEKGHICSMDGGDLDTLRKLGQLVVNARHVIGRGK